MAEQIRIGTIVQGKELDQTLAYIENLGKYSKHSHPLAFFSYIAGGFGNKILLLEFEQE